MWTQRAEKREVMRWIWPYRSVSAESMSSTRRVFLQAEARESSWAAEEGAEGVSDGWGWADEEVVREERGAER